MIIIVVMFLSSWLLQVRSQNTVPVPFLPVNPDYSATRNQVTVICVTYQASIALEFLCHDYQRMLLYSWCNASLMHIWFWHFHPGVVKKWFCDFQGRQKLARLTQAEFAALVLDVLKEIRRRQVWTQKYDDDSDGWFPGGNWHSTWCRWYIKWNLQVLYSSTQSCICKKFCSEYYEP